jgi:hypothetical protein
MQTPTQQLSDLHALLDWARRARLAQEAAVRLADFQASAARIRDFGDSEGEDSRPEVLEVAYRTLVTASQSMGAENAADPGFTLLVRELGGVDSTIATLLGVIRTLTEEVQP